MYNRIVSLFAGWEETMIWSCLQGQMGYSILDDRINPQAAQLVVGDFCFFAGYASIVLAKQAASPILVPRDQAWEQVIEEAWGNLVVRAERYATKKGNRFDLPRLAGYATLKEGEYQLVPIDAAIYRQAMHEGWSKDLCSQFADAQDYIARGIGVAVLHQGELVAGASSYTIYNGGIEIEIDTRPDFRQKGLATACGAALILSCLEKNLYPSWDAHDLRSLALAKKLGYRLDRAYPVYLKSEWSAPEGL